MGITREIDALPAHDAPFRLRAHFTRDLAALDSYPAYTSMPLAASAQAPHLYSCILFILQHTRYIIEA